MEPHYRLLIKSIAAIFFLLPFGALRAQINESDTARYQLEAALRGSYQAGNVELLRLTNQLEGLLSIAGPWVFKSQNSMLYQEIFGFKADNDLLSQNYLYFGPRNRVYPYAIGFVSTNFRRRIRLRYFAGAGLTYSLVRRPSHLLKLSTNLVREQTDFETSDFNVDRFDGKPGIDMWRGTLYARGRHGFRQGALLFNYELYWQQSLSDRINYRYSLTGGFDVQVFDGLYLQSRLAYTYEQVVVRGVDQRDLLWTWGVAYRMKGQ